MITPNQISDFREFSRFYTNLIGLLNRNFLNSRYSLPEVRVLYEIANTKKCTSGILIEKLQMDKGYLSRIIRSFEKKGVITRTSIKSDRRVSILSLTKKGKQNFARLDKASINQIRRLLARIPEKKGRAMVRHMNAIKNIAKPYFIIL